MAHSLRRAALLLVMAVMAGLLTVAASVPVSAAPKLDNGFVLRDIETGLRGISGTSLGDGLTDFAYLPDESLLVIGKFGKIMHVPRTGAPRQIANIPTNAEGDLGLNGLAIAPDFATSKAIYTARAVNATGPGTGANGVLRVSRWTVTTDAAGTPTGVTNEQTVIQTYADFYVHGISGLVAAPDGTVWVSIGDSADYRSVTPASLRAQNLDLLHGKVIHVNPDGTGVATNPYYNPASPSTPRSQIYASGFRSPFRISLDPVSGQPLLGDVGNGTIEEVNFITAGNNYGWPCWEGELRTGWSEMAGCAGVSTVKPLHGYSHNGTNASVTGGVVYTGQSYPEAYRGRYFFGDYSDRLLWTMKFNERGELTTAPGAPFGTDIGAPVKFGTVPTGGDIVYADIASGKLRRIVYSSANVAPDPAFTSKVDAATRTVTFDASTSRDPNGDPLTYTWAFGDGQTGAGEKVSHTYAGTQESFEVTLTANDTKATATKTATVYPSNHAPVLSVQPPDPNRLFEVGDLVAADGTATDAEDGDLTVTWSKEVVHCSTPAECHQHPGGRVEGPQFRMDFDGHPGDSRLEVTASAVDSKGAETTTKFVVRPKQRRITINSTSPAAFTIGDEQTSSGLFTVGTPLTIIAPAKSLDGIASFDQWAEGSTNRVREFVLPDADQVYEVLYATPIEQRYNSDAAIRAILGAPTDVEQGDSKVRWRQYAGGRLYWSQATGAHAMNGGILAKYLAFGGHVVLGLPTTDESAGANGGRYNLLSNNQGIYWHPNSNGAHVVVGAIHARYRAIGGDASALGYPTTDEGGAPTGRFNHFQRGSIYWTPQYGAFDLFGAVLKRWEALGGANGLGFPISAEADTPGKPGRFQNFQRGTIYWSAATNAWEVLGAIRTRYNQLGAASSYLGFPKSGEYGVTGGRRSDFQYGYIFYNSANGTVTDRRY